MQDQTETTQTFTPKTPDFKHRFDDCPSNSIGCAVDQIETVLRFLYDALEDARTLPSASNAGVEPIGSNGIQT